MMPEFMPTPTNSLIVSTYNRPDALDLVLKSALAQWVLPDEILIADDGSGPATRAIVEKHQAESRLPIKHIWHPDEGFRLSAIRNRAIAAASGDYIIQVDGDVLLHPKFISDHLAFAKPNSLVRASRCHLDEATTREMLAKGDFLVNIRSKGLSNKTSAMRMPLLWSIFETNYKNKGSEVYEIHGCNMAFYRQDAISVNGYNEDFEGWGYEDKEFVARLLKVGLKKRFLKLGGIVFNLHHPLNSQHREKENSVILENAIKNDQYYCSNGIDKHFGQ